MELANLIKIIKIISAITRVNYVPGAINEHSELVKDLRMDSLDISHLCIAIEAETDRDLCGQESSWMTVGDVLKSTQSPVS